MTTPGEVTHLEVSQVNVPTLPRHGESIGQTRIILKDVKNGAVLFDDTLEGHWFVLGFNKVTRTYLLGGIYERGAWLPLASILYLPEPTRTLVASAFNRSHYLAMTTQVSTDHRYIIFIGGEMTSGEVFVLDTQRDTLKKLGVAPAPPPSTLQQVCEGQPFEWGTCWADGYVDMDSGIIRFISPHEVEISYGKDTAMQRAKHRRLRRFKLDR